MADTGRGRGRGTRGRRRGRGRVPLSTIPEVSSTPFTPSMAGSSPQLHLRMEASHVPFSSTHAPSSSTQPIVQLSHTIKPSDPDEGKIWIAPGDVHLEFDLIRGPADVISDVIRSKFQGSWICWKEVPTTEKDMWFAKFRETYRWLPAHERQIRKIFDHKGQKCLKNAMNKLRAGKGKCDWVSPSIREQLDRIWASAEWKQRSERAKQNKAVDICASSYTSGSISTAEYKKRLKQDLQRVPSDFEIMERTKKLKEGNWACKKATDVASEYQRLREEDTNSEEDSSVVADNALFRQLVGERKQKDNVWSQVELMGMDALLTDMRERLQRHEQRMEYLYRHLHIDLPSISSSPNAQPVTSKPHGPASHDAQHPPEEPHDDFDADDAS